MSIRKLHTINIFSRVGLGFLFIYHGLVPKIIWLNPIEVQLVNTAGLSLSPETVSSIAGVFEILIGLAILVFRKALWLVAAVAALLILLVLSVSVVMPTLLVGAFNPLSTNILELVLCCIVVISQEQHRALNKTSIMDVGSNKYGSNYHLHFFK